MASYKTEGIILRRWNLGEADRVLSIFTKDYGRISAIAKGVRKPLSRLRGHLEPFTRAHFVLHEGRNFDVITQADALAYHPTIRENLRKAGTAYYFAELVEAVTGERDRQEQMYRLLSQALETLDRSGDGLLRQYVELNLLALAGYKPELSRCVVGNESLREGTNYFSTHLGGIVCATHQGSASDAVKISPNAIKVLRLFLSKDIAVVGKLRRTKLPKEELRVVIETFLRYRLEKEPKSKKFLRELEKPAKSGQNEK